MVIPIKIEIKLYQHETYMRPSYRSFIGTILLLIYITLYALLVMAFSASRINGSSWEGIFYVTAGFAWLPGAMLIISYMAKGRKS